MLSMKGLEIVHESGTPVLDGIEPVWTSDWQK